MNTPAHAVINLALLSREPSHRKIGVILAGAVIPDLAIIVFYAWQLAAGIPETEIWSTEYYRPLWQAWIDSFNSIPLIALAILLSWYNRRYLLLVFFASMLLHVVGDLPLHHDDAHRHFFPFLEWRFISPVSYWNPAHYGQWASLFEFMVVLVAAALMYRHRPLLRRWVVSIIALYLIYWGYVYVVWI